MAELGRAVRAQPVWGKQVPGGLMAKRQRPRATYAGCIGAVGSGGRRVATAAPCDAHAKLAHGLQFLHILTPFSGSAADSHLQYFSLSQTEAAGGPVCCSSRGKQRAERTPRAGVRGAKEPFASALSALRSDRLSPTGARSN
eukprot:6189165-Pleurochrysis_carterae.AAC.6